MSDLLPGELSETFRTWDGRYARFGKNLLDPADGTGFNFWAAEACEGTPRSSMSCDEYSAARMRVELITGKFSTEDGY